MMPGDEQSWSEHRDDPLQLAERFAQQGYLEKDPYLLNLARQNYMRAGRQEKAVLCEASALEFEEKYQEAGTRFEEFGSWAEACRCFWSAQAFQSLLALRQRFPEVTQDPRYLAAQFWESPELTWTQAYQILERLIDITSRAPGRSPGELSTWSQFVGRLIEGLRTSAVQPMKSANEIDQAVQCLRRLLEQLGLPLRRYTGIAELLYRAGHPHEAIEHWRVTATAKNEEPQWLIRAYADTSPYPANLRYIVRLKDDTALVEAWRKASADHGEEGEWTRQILASARKIKDWNAISGLIHHVDSIEDSLDTLTFALQEKHPDFFPQFPVTLLQLLANKREWQRFLRFAERQETGNSECDHLLKHSHIRWDADSLRGMAIRVLARSEQPC
jgi:tetratricopeptide (TPR) repeat protein